MLRLLGIVISIGLADSLNPTTFAPALYFASLEHAKERVFQFTAGVFTVYFLGGVLIALGPGQLLLSLVPHPSHTVASWLEIFAGVALLVGAALLILNRHSLSSKQLPGSASGNKSSFLLGAGIMVLELPTAFPYFAAIAAIVGSGFGPLRQVFLLLVFNICFIAPELAILATLFLLGDRAPETLAKARRFVERRWPLILGVAALIAGVFVIVLGVTGLTEGASGTVGRVSRGVHKVF